MTVRSTMFVGLLVASCATEAPAPGPGDRVPVQAFWPPVPATERVRYLYSFGGADDLGFKAPISRQLKDWLGGSEDEQMVRPYAIAVTGGLVAVTDPGLGIVHLFDTRARRYKRLRPPDKQELVSPVGVALGDDRIFVADSVAAKVFVFDGRNRLIRLVDSLQRPTGLAFDAVSQRLYVADTKAHEMQVFDRDGNFLQRFGRRGGNAGEFNFPTHLTISSGRLFVNDSMNFRIQVFGLDGDFITAFGEHGDSAGYLAQPKGVGVTSDGHIFVAESMSGKIQAFDLDGEFLMDFGPASESPFAFFLPAGLAISDDKIYVVDSGNRRVQVFEYRGAK